MQSINKVCILNEREPVVTVTFLSKVIGMSYGNMDYHLNHTITSTTGASMQLHATVVLLGLCNILMKVICGIVLRVFFTEAKNHKYKSR